MGGAGAMAAGSPESSEALLYLHGWAGSKELWWSSLREMSGWSYGVALDLPGTGETPAAEEPSSMADMARWVADMCARLGLKSVTLVGHSLGGNLAAQVALDHPRIVRRLVLVDAALDTASLPKRAFWSLSPHYGMHALKLARLASEPIAALGRRTPDDHQGGPLLALARRTRLYLDKNRDIDLQQQMRWLCENPLPAEDLSAIAAPVLWIHGVRDLTIPITHAREIVRELPHWTLHAMPGADHSPMDHDPEGFARIIRRFCQEKQS
ncbi:alpha/beta hydrolase [Capsulimonas corticalis]|uniref:Alpha/beta hydrolase n=1 Tax=Capsulimonas corticalis TaxID=2219043 RepID=A0A402D2Y0_9BACT|nr:alpha/beta hydrolase [Capsulimonas corticalis]